MAWYQHNIGNIWAKYLQTNKTKLCRMQDNNFLQNLQKQIIIYDDDHDAHHDVYGDDYGVDNNANIFL